MEKHLNEIKKSRNVRDSSLNLYRSYMNKLNKEFNNDKEFSIGFIKDNIKDIIKYIETHSNSVARNYYASLLVFLSPEGKAQAIDGFQTIYDEVQTKLKSFHKIYLDSKQNNKKNSKEDANWIEFEEIIKKRMKIEKIVKNTQYDDKLTKQEYNNLMEYIILSLYSMIPPRRNEYGTMVIVSDKEYQDLSLDDMENNNYLIIGKSNFVFSYGKNAVKSSGDTDTQIIDIPKDLSKVLKFWLKYNKTGFLLPKYNENKPIGKNGLTLFLNKIFSPKKISTSMLRKIYLSYRFGENQKERAKVAEEMNHSTAIANQIYIKE